MAVPYVTGLAGLIKSIRPDLNSLQIKYTILDNVDKINSLSGKILTGGRIDAFKALTNIMTDTAAPTVSVNLKEGSYYHHPLNVSLTASKPATIYYTLNGTLPTQNSLIYINPIVVNTTKTLKFIAVDTSGTQSIVYSKTCKIYKLVTYSYKALVPYKKIMYKQWYKEWYKLHGKWRYYWTYTWKYKWLYKYETLHGEKSVLI